MSGKGIVSTWVVIHKAWFPAFAADIPYNVVQVELAEGPRLTAKMVGLDGKPIKVGEPVVVDFEDVDDELTLPVFRPTHLAARLPARRAKASVRRERLRDARPCTAATRVDHYNSYVAVGIDASAGACLTSQWQHASFVNNQAGAHRRRLVRR